jgi:hypothetical protein
MEDNEERISTVTKMPANSEETCQENVTFKSLHIIIIPSHPTQNFQNLVCEQFPISRVPHPALYPASDMTTVQQNLHITILDIAIPAVLTIQSLVPRDFGSNLTISSL